jgi:hypothetical protein
MGKRFRILLSILVALFLIGGVPSHTLATVQLNPDQMAVYLNGNFSRLSGSGNIVGDLYTANGDLSFGGGPPAFTGTFYHKTGTAFNYPLWGWDGFDSRSQELNTTTFEEQFPNLAEFPAIENYIPIGSNENMAIHVSENTHFGEFKVTSQNHDIIFDLTTRDIHVVIDKLNLSQWKLMNITGSHTLFLYINDVIGSSTMLLINGNEDPSQLYIMSKDYIPMNSNYPLYANVIYQGIPSFTANGFTYINGSLITDATQVNLPGNDKITGLLYAPNASTNMGGSTEIKGRLVAKSLDMTGSSKIIYNANYSTLNIPSELFPQPPQVYTVNVAVNPVGAGTVTPTYTEVTGGQSINIQTTANPGYVFSHFTANDSSMVPDSSGNVSVTGHVEITAHFVLIAPPTGYLYGLLGEYYDDATLENDSALRMRRIDSNIAFNFGYEPPVSVMEPESFSIRWTGYIRPLVTGNYTFKTYSDDGVRLTVNGTKLIDNWGLLNLEYSIAENPVYLEAGSLYPILVEYQQLPLYAAMFLFWESENTPMTIIPETNFIIEEIYENYITPQYYNLVPKQGIGFNNVFYEMDNLGNIDYSTKYETIDQIFYSWFQGAPGTITSDAFYGKMDGYLEAKFTENLTLHFLVDDGLRVRINDDLVIDQWNWNNQVIYSYTFPVTIGEKYRVSIEYADFGLGASIWMLWESNSLGYELVPKSAMYPLVE